MNTTMVETMLDNLLAAAVALTTDPPARQYVAHGLWAHDCECLVVELTDAHVEPVENIDCATRDVISLEATILRCWPTVSATGDLPDPAAITAAGRQLAGDAAALVGGFLDKKDDGSLFPGVAELVECGQVAVNGSRPIGPEGGLAGWAVSLTVRP